MLQRQVSDVVDLSNELIRIRQQQSAAAALEKMATESGKAPLDALRRNVADIRANQQIFMEEWSEESNDNHRTTLVSIINATIGALLLVGAVYVLARRDRAETSRTEGLLRTGEARFRRLVDANVMGVLFANFDGRVSDANDAFLNMIGYSRADLAAGRINWRQLTPPEFGPVDEQAIAELKSRGVSVPFEKEFMRRTGPEFPAWWLVLVWTSRQTSVSAMRSI